MSKPVPAEQPVQKLEPVDPNEAVDDDEFATSEYDAKSVSYATTSISSSVLQHHYENGRRYHQYRNGRYPIPNDDVEQNRDDMKHAMMLELTDGKHFLAPLKDDPKKIIDLGTGTGIWAIEVADKFPNAEVLGIDLSPIQPTWVPTNLKFIVDDVEDEWTHGDDWDLVHLRCLSPWLKDEPKLLKAAFDHMRPGGWIEIQEFDGRANCDDDSVTPETPMKKFFDLIPIAMAKFGMNFNAAEGLRAQLEAAGFTEVNCRSMKVPYGPWVKDKKLRLIGMYSQIVMSDLVNAMAAKPFRQLEELNEAELKQLASDTKKDIQDNSVHAYINYMFWTAKKPE